MNSNISVYMFSCLERLLMFVNFYRKIWIYFIWKKKRNSNQIQLFSAGFSNLNVTDALLQLKEASIVFLLWRWIVCGNSQWPLQSSKVVFSALCFYIFLCVMLLYISLLYACIFFPIKKLNLLIQYLFLFIQLAW